MSRLYLSPPHMSGEELPLVEEAFRTNWIAPLGPHVDSLEQEFCKTVGVRHAAALSSGTAALHLAVRLAGVRRGDEVLCSSLTFVASANPILYEGAVPVFVDSNATTWNLDPQLLEEELTAARRRGRMPRALILAHLYGQSADLDPIVDLCRRHDVVLIEDAAEALGATYKGKSPGAFGRMSIFSFNGNKIITTSGGGMLVSDDADLIQQARFLSTQARDPAPHYEHSRMGFNYRMSNVLAAIGRGQLRVLADRVRSRRAICELYRKALKDVPGISWMPEAPYGQSTRWLTVAMIDPEYFGATAEEARRELESRDIEARPVWKPLHLQPLFRDCRKVGGEVSERLFQHGLCLPSGSQMTEGDVSRVVDALLSCRLARLHRVRTTRRLAS
jgi:dTDP-4-amino-4,6-dideoxygalactose transaminase